MDAYGRRQNCLDPPSLTESALEDSKQTMEDFLLRGERRSADGLRGVQALHAALSCDPSHAKAWYRFGFLLRRQTLLPDAAALALERAIELNPQTSGPAHAEMTLLHLARLVEASDDKAEAEHARLAKESHAFAMRRNPTLALHTLKASFGEAAASAFPDVLASVMEERQRRQNERDGRGRPEGGSRRSRSVEASTRSVGGDPRAGALVDLQACEASRAQSDVLRLQGEHAAADELDRRLRADLAGRELPPPAYMEG